MATRTYENIVVMGDINIDTDDDEAIGQNKLSEFCDIFGLENLIQGSSCVTRSFRSTTSSTSSASTTYVLVKWSRTRFKFVFHFGAPRDQFDILRT